MARYYSEEEKQAYIAEWKESGLPGTRSAREKGLTRSAFCRWVEESEGGRAFVKVADGRRGASSGQGTIEVEYKGAVLHVPSSSVLAVLQALGRVSA